MPTGAHGSHGTARNAGETYMRAVDRRDRRRRQLRLAAKIGLLPRQIDLLASREVEADQLVRRIGDKYLGNPDADGDWITERSEP